MCEATCRCGVVYCYKKFLNLLPVMIEEEEDEEASEVRPCTHPCAGHTHKHW